MKIPRKFPRVRLKKSNKTLSFMPTTPGGRGRAFSRRARYYDKKGRQIKNLINAEIKKKIKLATDPQEVFQREMDKLNKTSVLADIEGTEYQKITGPAMQGAEDLREQGCVSRSHTVLRSAEDTIGQGKLRKTSVHTGFPLTKTLKLRGKQNGTTVQTLNDTEVDVVDPLDRVHLTRSFGFNQKMIWNLDNNLYWTLADIYTIFSGNLYQPAKNVQSVYADTHYFASTLKIRNVNFYLRQKVKVHLMVQKQKDFNALADFSDFTFNNSQLTQQIGRIPVNKQFGDIDQTNKEGGRHIVVDPSTSIGSSTNLQDMFEKAKTFTATLGAGEEWVIDHKHHTGPGIRMDRVIAQYTQAGGDHPSSAPFFYYVIEANGCPTQLISNADSLIRYSGTAAGGIHVEAKKYYKVGLAAENTVYAAADEGGFFKTDYGFRIYTKRTPGGSTPEKLFNKPSSQITFEGDPTPDTYRIPVITDATAKPGGLQK